MKRKLKGKAVLRKKGDRLKREALATAKSTVGLAVPPMGTAIGIYDTAKRIPRLVRATRDYGDALINEAKRRLRHT